MSNFEDRQLGNGELDSRGPTFQGFGFTADDILVGRAPRDDMHIGIRGQMRGERQTWTKHDSQQRFMLPIDDQDPKFGDDSRRDIKHGRGESHTRGEVQRRGTEHPSEQRANFNSSGEEPQCQDIHEMNVRVVLDHVFRRHNDRRRYRGETDPVGVAGSLRHCFTSEESMEKTQTHNDAGFDGELISTSKACEEEQTHRENHVRNNQDVDSHEVVNHCASQRCLWALDQFEVDVSSKEETQAMPETKHPWTASRVLAQYLALRMKAGEPTACSIVDYDGLGSWKEEEQEPPVEYKRDV